MLLLLREILRATIAVSRLLDVDPQFTVTARTIERNLTWVRPTAKMFKSACPTAYFLADSFLELHKKFPGGLFIAGDGKHQSLDALALREGFALKKLMSGLRYLRRNGSRGKSGVMTELKGYLEPGIGGNAGIKSNHIQRKLE